MASVDFENAYNRVHRPKMFDFVRKHFPSISNYVERTYGISSELLYGEFIVSSSSGVQQGDPLSPALFCLILQPLLEVIAANSDIKVFAYLDDTNIFGPLAQFESALSYLDIEGPASGLIRAKQGFDLLFILSILTLHPQSGTSCENWALMYWVVLFLGIHVS